MLLLAVLSFTVPHSLLAQRVKNGARSLNVNPAEQPNIILINLDDADAALLSPNNILARYPNLSRFVFQGIQLTNFHATTPLCGPSRACLLRGQYAHRTGIMTNDPNSPRSNGFPGGMLRYRQQGFMQDDLSIWMQQAGYRTMLVGKYLHHDVEAIVPPGWDDFYHYLGGNYFGTYLFSNKIHAAGFGQQMPSNTYRTELETENCVDLINRHADRQDGKPFFLYLNPLAPHNEAAATADLGMIAESYQHWWTSLRMPRDSSIDEINFSDKTTALREVDRFDQSWNDLLEKRYRDRVLAVRSVDDMFAAIYDTLGDRGLRDNTYIFLTSDNGMLVGEHRLFGKAINYDPASRVPAYVIGPGVAAGAQARHLLAQIDLAPTFVDIAGGVIPENLDGKSFKNVILNPDAFDERSWREALLIENWESRRFRGETLHLGSNTVRFFDEVYSEWADGTSEYYDLNSDPLQLRNTFDDLSGADQQLYANYMRLLKNTGVRPEVTISEPWEANTLLSRKDRLFGMAQDDAGVQRVEVAIRRIDDFRFWNGSEWQSDRVRVTAEVTNPGQQLTSWRLESLPRMESSSQLVGIWPRVFDTDGNANEAIPSIIFRVDWDRPESAVTEPAIGSAMNQSPIVVRGTATDDRDVETIRLVVNNQTTGEYYDGNQWQSTWTFLNLPIFPDGSWSYTLPPLNGAIYVASRAVDDSGNVQKTPAFTYFLVNE